ncbi:MAG: SPASM domain-containing protein [bacterium]|nr:SPASM domain-containing protein [bacterium]
MKQSKYNFFYKLENGRFIAFNALKNGLAVVGPDIVDAVTSLDNGSIPKLKEDVIKELKRGGFICEDECDEYGVLAIRKNMQQYSTDGLGLTIAPTINCNFACSYCFENPDPQVMDDKVMKGVVDFAKTYIESGIKHLGTTLYGGEPTMCMDVIEKLSNDLIAVCEKNNVAYSSFVVTNGSLFTRETAERLKKLKVNGAQITIDGNKNIHNQRRPFKNGKGSFDCIWENVKDSAGVIPISIRVNVDKTNVDDVLAFLARMKQEEWFKEYFGEKIFVHLGYVKKFTSSCRCSKEESLKPGDFWHNELELHKYLHKNGYGFDRYPDISSGCSATSINGYVVGPDGNLYKCWNHLGIAEYAVGNVFKPIEMNPLYVSYLMESFDKDPECRECEYLPICMGGCVDIRVKSKRGEFDTKDCAGWKYYLEDALREYHKAKIQHPSA